MNSNFSKTILLASLTLSFFISSCSKPVYQNALSDKYRLVWNDNPENTVTVIWDQLKEGNPKIYYGKEDFGRDYDEYPLSQEPTRKLLNYYGMNTHFAEIKGLEPDQNYYFVIKDEFGVSKRYYFRTAPDTPKPFTFVMGGDTKSFDESLAAGRSSNKLVSRLAPLFVIFNGDFTSGDGTYPDRWQQWLHDWDTLTTTPDGRMIPIVPIHGNHENGNKSVLNKIFNAPFQYEDSTNIFYSISFGNDFVHIIALNSEIEVGGRQKDWLENDLKENEKYRLKISAYHKPFRPHTQKKREQDYLYEQWAPLFYDYGMNLSLAGDSHMHNITYPVRPSNEDGSYEGFIRDDKNGTVFLGEGSWGAHPRINNDDKPWTLQSGSFNQIKWIHVTPKNKSELTVEIFTVISAKYDDKDSIYLYSDGVEYLNDDDLFKIPKNINLYNPDGETPSVKFTFTKK